ncbi:biotin--[acetyl-CoA-carboxylase] ligase [Microbacterium foliorum]|uniref:biotin--[biotin carboxyl-carrier protein] ligase n=1 Tax=Microbacterium foliorum TaxID=104336 RepID=A0A4Y5YPQ9_9MICO|nr:biotin--[acetyl-CoA-carboxylase] ligase [Microbacterium foliorum]QDE34409.1 biotin--[acetyl-CoA-carboxylase] ligase [Microbacterium foliorum]
MELPLTAAVASHLEVLTDAGSTNEILSERARESLTTPPHLSVLLTDNQTAGRGRLGRSWTAAPGASLAVSVLLRRLPSGDARGWIPLAAGVAMADAIAEQLPDHEVAVKWPNDVLVDGRKICGILTQATHDAVVVGTGVNTAMTESQLPVPTATSFAVLGVAADADRLLATYLRGLDELVADLAAAGDAVSSGLHAAASRRCATIGLDVRVSLPGGSVLVGTATALDADGRLLVRAGGAERPISAGDVVHVRPA